jgi:hypothetical protein
MARKLSVLEFLDRHWREREEVVGLFNGNRELRYSDMRKKLTLDNRSRRENQLEDNDSENPGNGLIRHETELIRLLKAMCKASILEKRKNGKKAFYRLRDSKADSKIFRSSDRIAVNLNVFDELVKNKEELDTQLKTSKNRIYELNLEIGKLTAENIELRDHINLENPNSQNKKQ